jgi:hypothetical protein
MNFEILDITHGGEEYSGNRRVRKEKDGKERE